MSRIDVAQVLTGDRPRPEKQPSPSELIFRETFNAIPTLAWCARSDGSCEFLNQRWHNFTGLTAEQAHGAGWQVAIHPDDLPEILKKWREILTTGEDLEVEARLRRHDGVYRWFLFRCNPQRDASGAIAKWCGVNTDIDDFKRAQQALAESERVENRQIAHSIAGMVAVFSPEGVLNGGNQRLLDYFQLPLEEIGHWDTNGITHPDDLQHCIDSFMGSIRSGEPYDFETRFKRHDGVFRWFQIRGLPLRDANGSIIRWYGLLHDIDERKRAEQALAESERENRQIAHSIPGMVAVFSPDGVLNGGNQPLLDYFKLPLEEIAQWATNDVVHPDDLQHSSDSFMPSLASGEPYDFEARFRRHDGVYRWFQIRGMPLRDAAGRIMRWYGLLHDIDERKRAEQALAASERKARIIVDTIPGLVVHFRPDGFQDGANAQFLEYLGQSLEHARDWGTNGAVHPDDVASVSSIFAQSLQTGEPYEMELRIKRHDGVYRWFQVRGRPHRDDDGQITAWYGLITDINDRKIAEHALAESERENRQIAHSIPGMVVVLSPSGNLDGGNQPLLDYFKLPLEEIGRWTTNGMTHPDDLERCVDSFGRAIASGEPYDFETRFRRHDGVFRWFQIRGMPLRDADGRIIRWYGLLYDIDERKRTEQALAESERKAHIILETIPGFVVQFRPGDGYMESANTQFLDYLGLPLDEAQAWGSNGVVHPDDVEVATHLFAGSLDSGEPYEMQIRLRRHDGIYRWFHIRGQAHRDSTGKIVNWYGLLTDTDDRKRAETELRRSDEHLSQAQRLSSTGSFTTDVLADKHTWSKELYRILEYEGGEAATFQAFRNQIHKDDLPRFDEGFRRSMADRVEFDEVFRIETPKGNTKYLRAVAQFVPGNPERPIVIGSIQDVTKAKNAEAELKRSATFLAEGQRISLTGTFAWQVDTDEFICSDQLKRIHEFDRDADVTAAAMRGRIHPEDTALLEGAMSEVQGGSNSPDYEVRLLMPDGRIKYVRSVARTVRHEDGRLECIGAVQDVTNRRLAEDALDNARAELARVTRALSFSALTASIAHEVNQPLSGIITNANTCVRMLTADPPNVSGALETARRAMRDGNRASEVIVRLRDLFRRKEFIAEPVDLQEITQEVLALTAQELRRRRVAVQTRFDANLPKVLGDRVQLQQVVLNLILNAADAMAGVWPRQIVIETTQNSAGEACLTVHDIGIGIRSEDTKKVFDPFYTTKPDGMGIGLSVSRSIVERHRGRLLAAANEGKGTTFALSLPIAPVAG